MNECQWGGRPIFSADLKQISIANFSQLVGLCPFLVIAVVAGFLFDRLQIPVGWLLGPMTAGMIWAGLSNRSLAFAPALVIFSRAVLGMMAASRFSPTTAQLAVTYALPLLVCIPLAAGLSLMNGYLLWRWTGIDRATSFLGCIPGASFGIIAMSEDMGADALVVAMLQYIRVLLVVTIVPAIATYCFPHPHLPVTPSFISLHPLALPPWLDLPLIGAGCGLGIALGGRLRLPSSAFLGSFLVGLTAFWNWPQSLYLPRWLFLAALLVVGVSIGLRFDWQTARKLCKAALIDVGLVLLTIFSCLLIACGFHQVARVDAMTAILGFTPGAVEAMVATTIQLGGDTGLVVAMQMTRMFLILFFCPWIIGLWLKPKND